MSSDQIKPVIREDKLYEMRNHLAEWLEAYHPEIVRTCLTCVHFQEGLEQCAKFKARPPARVIAYGCNQYFNEDEIPF